MRHMSVMYNRWYKFFCLAILTNINSSYAVAVSAMSSQDCEKPVLYSDQKLLEVEDFAHLGWSVSIHYYETATWVLAAAKESLVDDDQFLISLNSRLKLIKLSLPKVEINNAGLCKNFLEKAMKIL